MTTVNDDETATGTPGTPATSRRRLLGSVGAAGVAGYHDGIGGDGVPDAGLLFVAWQADPLRRFVPVRRKLARADGLSRFLRHAGERAVRGAGRGGSWRVRGAAAAGGVSAAPGGSECPGSPQTRGPREPCFTWNSARAASYGPLG
jgi:hypothetical protein